MTTNSSTYNRVYVDNRTVSHVHFTVDPAVKKIMILGDVHAGWASLNKLIFRFKPELVIQVGDFGFFPRSNFFGSGDLSRIKLYDTNIVFCGGNHEDWSVFKDISESGDLEVSPGIFYAPRCSTITLPNKQEGLFLGGAASIDQAFRKEGIDWFREEVIPESVMYFLPDKKIDILFCHTTPIEFTPISDPFVFPDGSRGILSEVVKIYQPSRLFCGHWHVRNEYFHSNTGTHMVCLSNLYEYTITRDSWCWLEEVS